MKNTTLSTRQSKYCTMIETEMARLGHASNHELLGILREYFPDLSATTVHRATARLASRGQLGMAPATKDGAMRYDARLDPHDHFQCSSCFRLRDANIRDIVVSVIQDELIDCEIGGRLVVSGICKDCKINNEVSSGKK